MKSKKTISDVARKRLSDDEKFLGAGEYSPKNAQYVKGKWIRNNRIIGFSQQEDSKFIPKNRSRNRGH